MSRALEIEPVTEDLIFWQAYDPEVKADLSSCAVRCTDGWVLIDPIDLAQPAWSELLEIAPPSAIVLTSGNHARAAAEISKRASVPIIAHSEAAQDLGIRVDRTVGEGDTIAGNLTVVDLPGAGPGEIALCVPGASVHIGDALINLEHHGFTFLPDRYCADPKALRISLKKLLSFDFARMTFAHGMPIVSDAKLKLSRLVS